jgi:FAD/FMN-containing dehydrogenase
MGQKPSSPLGQCLTDAIGSAKVALPDKPLYQLIDVRPYNLDIAVSPLAVTYPGSNEDVAAVIKCATTNSAKVQARSGGHSYGNYGLGGGNNNTVVIDLENFDQFSMDTNTWIATLGAGYLLEMSRRGCCRTVIVLWRTEHAHKLE